MNQNFSNLKFEMEYSSLKRDTKKFYSIITDLIDLLSKNTVPKHSLDCKLCKFVIKQSAFL